VDSRGSPFFFLAFFSFAGFGVFDSKMNPPARFSR
jgi:hypothetical protein